MLLHETLYASSKTGSQWKPNSEQIDSCKTESGKTESNKIKSDKLESGKTESGSCGFDPRPMLDGSGVKAMPGSIPTPNSDSL